MNAETDHLFLSRPEMSKLIDELRKLPRIVEDLAVTIARLARVQAAGHSISLGAAAQSRPPIHLDAWQAEQALHWHLATTVRIVCEERGMSYVPVGWLGPDFIGPPRPGQQRMQPGHVPSTLELGRWLDRHVVSLAMTADAGALYLDLLAAIAECEALIDLPPDDLVQIDQRRVDAANNKILTAYQIEKVAAKLGDVGRGLTRDRVRYLAKRGLREAGRDGETRFYRLGDVLAKHVQHGRRSKGGSAA